MRTKNTKYPVEQWQGTHKTAEERPVVWSMFSQLQVVKGKFKKGWR